MRRRRVPGCDSLGANRDGARILSAVVRLHAQGNYEIQVYGAPTVEAKTTMFELHSNFTIDGQKEMIDGVSTRPTIRSTKRSRSPRASTIGRRWVSTSSPAFRMATAGSGSATTFGRACELRIRGTGRLASAYRRRSAISAPSILPIPGRGEIRPIFDKSAGRWYSP